MKMAEQKTSQPHGEPQPDTEGGEAKLNVGNEPEENAEDPSEISNDARVAELEAELESTKADYLRALAEVENTRRRAVRDRTDATQFAISGFARDILSVADNLRRALDTVDEEARAREPVLESLTNGVAMTERELLTILERHGVKPIAAAEQQFDPHVHEAMFEIPNDTVPHGTVLQVLEHGYTLNDRTLRPARVGISKGGPKAETPQQPAPDAADQTAQGDASHYEQAGGNEQKAAGSRVDETL
jgi:molecular chaperone GrpE